MGCDLTTSSETTQQTTTVTSVDDSDSSEITYPERYYSEFEKLHIEDAKQQLSQNHESYYIYYYGLFCGACTNIKNEVLSKIELLENDVIYLVEVGNSSDIQEDIAVEYTPSLVQISNGAVEEIYVGGTSILNVINSLS